MTTSSEPPADITLTSPAELLSAVPYLLGHVPTDSLVLVGLDAKRVTVTLRVDLPPAAQPVTDLRITTAVLRRNNVEAVILAGFGPPERVTRCVDHVRRLLRDADVELVDALRVTDGRFWSYVCRRPSCCPEQGTPVSPPDSPVDAAFTVGGMRALPDRGSVAAQLEPVRGHTRAAVTRATNRVRRLLTEPDTLVPNRAPLRSQARAILTETSAPGANLPTITATVTLAAAVADAKFQAEALAMIDERGPHATVDLWVWVTRHAAPEFRAVPAALLGFAAWRCGNGVLACEAVRLALRDDPTCGLAVVLSRMLDAGVPPGAVPRITARVRSPTSVPS